MQKKIICILVSMLLISTTLPIAGTVLAGDEENPEIEDETGDARAYLDIEKVWFHEDKDKPDILYTTIKLDKPSYIAPKQHLTVHWVMNGEHYSSGLTIGYDFDQWFLFYAIEGLTYFGEEYNQTIITGKLNKKEGSITCEIPKSAIGNPEPGDVLTKTYSECFQRFGLWGILGFSPKMRETLFLLFDLPSLQVFDFAPDILPGDGNQGYGNDYSIQY